MRHIDPDKHGLTFVDDSKIRPSQRLIGTTEFQVEFKTDIGKVLIIGLFKLLREHADVAYTVADIAGLLDTPVQFSVIAVEDSKDHRRLVAGHQVSDRPLNFRLQRTGHSNGHARLRCSCSHPYLIQCGNKPLQRTVQVIRSTKVLPRSWDVDVEPRPRWQFRRL